jgi:DNA replication ATP-dependent helicase Dna2
MKKYILLIVREYAETILGAGVTDEEAIEETSKFILELQRFASQYILTDAEQSSCHSIHKGHQKSKFSFQITDVHSLEEAAVSPELGLKGNVDALVNVVLSGDSSPTKRRLMGMELKTGHNQNLNQAHTIQLSLYVLMLQARYAIDDEKNGGILMYLNNEGQKAIHITPTSNEFKSLMSIRNHIVNEKKKSLEPRGIIANRTKQEDERRLAIEVMLANM